MGPQQHRRVVWVLYRWKHSATEYGIGPSFKTHLGHSLEIPNQICSAILEGFAPTKPLTFFEVITYIYIVSIKDQIIESETNGYSSSPGLPYVCHYPKSMRTASGLEIEIEKIYTLTRIHKEIHMYLENLFIYTFEIANT